MGLSKRDWNLLKNAVQTSATVTLDIAGRIEPAKVIGLYEEGFMVKGIGFARSMDVDMVDFKIQMDAKSLHGTAIFQKVSTGMNRLDGDKQMWFEGLSQDEMNWLELSGLRGTSRLTLNGYLTKWKVPRDKVEAVLNYFRR